MSLKASLMDAAADFARSSASHGEPASIDVIVDHLMEEFAAEIEEDFERAAREFVRRAAKDGLSEKPSATRQQTLPGFDVPAFITVPVSEGHVVYVAIEQATREQAHAHILMKDANIQRAIDERRKYIEFLDRLEPVWTARPDLTVGQCVDRLDS